MTVATCRSTVDPLAAINAAGIQERTKLFAYVDFNAPESALITKLDGSPLGILKMLGASPRGVDITDDQAMDEARERRRNLVERVLAQVQARPLHQQKNAELGAAKERNDQIVAAYQRETAAMPVADKIAVARGEAAAVQSRCTTREKALQAAGNDSAALIDEPAAADAPTAGHRPAQPATITHQDSEDLL